MFAALLAVLISAPIAALGEGESEATAERPAERTYVVQPGDSLWSIAERHGLSVDDLAEANGFDATEVIHAGRELRLPDAAPAAPPRPTFQNYTVKRGDSLWRIAHRFGTTAQAIAQASGIPVSDLIHPGQRLRVPAAGSEGSQADGDDTAQSLVETALQYRGVRYRYGGMTTRGMDCSGLVARALNIHGIDAPRTSRALYGLGTAVSRDQLKPGDLVFFRTTGRGISHVGIYMGEGQFIHASSGSKRVQVDRLDQGYYHQRYVGARRVE